jgi:methylglyoxal synthase
MSRIALIAHDSAKALMVSWANTHACALATFELVTTGTTGSRLTEVFPQFNIVRVLSGPLGGDQQIGAMIAEGKVDALVFFIDALSAMPHDVDVKALTRMAVLYDIPFACNKKTADAVIAYLMQEMPA